VRISNILTRVVAGDTQGKKRKCLIGFVYQAAGEGFCLVVCGRVKEHWAKAVYAAIRALSEGCVKALQCLFIYSSTAYYQPF